MAGRDASCAEVEALIHGSKPSPERRAEILSHLDACEPCAELVDSAAPAPELFLALGGEDLDPNEERVLAEELAADREHADSIRAAVREVLFPSLSEPTRRAFDESGIDDLLKIDAAVEAVSAAIRSHERQDLSMRPDGSVWSGEARIIDAAQMAEQVARYADLWEPSQTPWDGESEPSAQAWLLTEWVYRAARDNPLLLRHFRGATRGGAVTLVPMGRAERKDDSAERWALGAQERSGHVLIIGIKEWRHPESEELTEVSGWVLPEIPREEIPAFAAAYAPAMTGRSNLNDLRAVIIDSDAAARLLTGMPKRNIATGSKHLHGVALTGAKFKGQSAELRAQRRTVFLQTVGVVDLIEKKLV